MPTPAQYLKKHNNSGFKVGDTVTLERIAEDQEGGWQDGWNLSMSKLVGQSGTICYDYGVSGFMVEINGSKWRYPYFVFHALRKVYVPISSED